MQTTITDSYRNKSDTQKTILISSTLFPDFQFKAEKSRTENMHNLVLINSSLWFYMYLRKNRKLISQTIRESTYFLHLENFRPKQTWEEAITSSLLLAV
jgi:hypothetical protein